MTAAGKVGRPRMTDAAQLLAAARRFGLADLTVGKVTDACGVRYSTFYRSWSSLDALVSAYVDQVLAEFVPTVEGSPWRWHLNRLASCLSAAVEAEPGLREALGRVPEPQALREARERAVAELQASGFVAADAVEGAAAVVGAAIFCPVSVPLVLDGLGTRLPEQQL